MLQIKNTLGGGKPEGSYVWKKYEYISESYLRFIGNEDFTLKTLNTSKNWDGTLEYSTDATTWSTWNGTEVSSSGNNLYLRGTGNTKISGSTQNYAFVFTGADTLRVACEGNIENLLDYETVTTGGNPTMANYCYSNMFNGCTSLTTAPQLPATTLKNYCYSNMFKGCTRLTTAPELPATTLMSSCYSGMFYGCTSLTTAPQLPATTLADYGYNSMFYGCTSLTTAPELPATILPYYGYSNMFSGCISLTAAPELPATTLDENCYSNMFNGCTNLTTVPSILPATTLKNSCYSNMFNGCTSLTTAPQLPATTLANNCYTSMFKGCTYLMIVPELPATILKDFCYRNMFYGCTNIKLSSTQTGEYQTAYRIPTSDTGTTGSNSLLSMFTNTGGTFTGTPTINTTYYLSTSNFIV